MMSKYYKLLFLTLCLALQLNGQELIDPNTLPEVEDYTVIRTNPGADTVILTLHGGPTSVLLQGSFGYFEEVPTFSVVDVSKHEMLTPVLENDSLNFEEGVAMNDTTAALIEKAAQHYLDQDKTVVLIGHSWGAIILGEFMDDYGADHIHRIIPMEGRLNIQPEFVDHLLDGYLPTFGFDGYTIELNSGPNIYSAGLLNLAAAAFDNRWVDSLAHLDLRNMMYTYAENDMQTGALLPEETEFLNDTGARTFFIPAAGHGASFGIANQDIIIEFIREEIIMSNVSGSIVLDESFKLFPSLADSWVQIESTHNGSLAIFDFTGALVYQAQEIEYPKQVDVSQFASGQYVAVLRNDEGVVGRARFQVLR